MAELIIKYRSLEHGVFRLRRSRTTIGRSARNDLRLPDRFASQSHAVIYREQGKYFLIDLGSTNGTVHNDSTLEASIPVPLASSDTIRIGEVEIIFQALDSSEESYSTEAMEDQSAWDDEITWLQVSNENSKQYSKRDHPDSSQSEELPGGLLISNQSATGGNLQNFITKVGIILLGSATLNDILKHVAVLALEAVSADRCLVLLRDEETRQLKIAVEQLRQPSVDNDRNVAIPVEAEGVASRGRAVLSDIRPDSQGERSRVLQTIKSLVAVPLEIRGSVFGVIYAESSTSNLRFDTTDLKILTTLASIAAIRIENEQFVRLEEERERYRLDYESYLATTFSDVQSFLRGAGFELKAVECPSFVAEPMTIVWKKRIKGGVYTHLHIGRPLDGKSVLGICDLSQKAGERFSVSVEHAFVVVDEPVEDSAWLQIAALRSIKFDVIPIPVTLVKGNSDSDATLPQGLVLSSHLERFIGKGTDPYDIRDPVSDVLNFFGREALARTLADRLISGRAVGLFGLRKMGKSSLLNYLKSLIPYPTAKLDLQAGVTPASVFERLLRLWNIDAQARFGIDLGLRKVVLDADNYSAEFNKLSQRALDSLANRSTEARLALFLDEIELVTPPPDAPREELTLYLSLLRTIRGLVQENGRFSLMVAGVDASINRINRWGREQNPLYQLVQEVYLPPLLTPDCIQMIRNIGQQVELTYSDTAEDFIAQASGGHPFLARQLCSLAYAEQKQRPGEMRLEYLQEAAERFLFDPQYAVYLNHRGLWSESTNVELWGEAQSQINQAILGVLASADGPVPESALIDEPDSYGKRAALFSLAQLHIIQSIDDPGGGTDRHFVIPFGLFRSWLRRSLLGLKD
ncbi:MAG TPA: FHA domain-containing protein [Pyrinomonadaceae bacterium]|jgi:pSer/pThr/pTyr-binding forkhead associated (FHA) protein|nr:FHA domain-containing protein [Pyrinomonadaceae bacterium]